MSRMTRFAALAGALLMAGSASAQYYEPSPYRDRGPPRYSDDRGPPRGYDDRGPPRYDDRGPPRGGYDRRPDRPPGRFSGMCFTSRGTCEVPPSPRGSACRCYIEGFGAKRGAIQ